MKAQHSIGDIVNGWEILQRIGIGRYLFKCPLCQNTRKGAPSIIKKLTGPCGDCKSDQKSGKVEIGQTFGYWQVDKIINKSKVECTCLGCGKRCKVCRWDLQKGKSKSCGCHRGEFIKKTCLSEYGVPSTTLLVSVQEKQKQTLLDRYGVDNYRKSVEFQEQAKQTSIEKYGVEYPSQAKEIREKIKQTNLSKYGTENPMQLPEFQEKAKQTNLHKFGVEYPAKLSKYRKKAKQTNLHKYGVESISQLPEYRYKLKEWCEENPEKQFTSKAELEILDWIQTFYPDAKKYKTEGNELDIFIPEINLGIEHNGLYWHAEDRPHIDRNYHLNKTKFFKEKKIRVIHIFEHEWKESKEQVKSFIQSAINKNKFKIGARKCSFIWTDLKKDKREVAEFLDTYHIQGKCSFSYAIKVFHKDQLVGVATFGKHHRNSKDWVLSRFCTKQNYTIQGGLAKISKLAYSKLNSPLISWAHYRLSDGNGYLKAGWKYEELLRPDYFYHKGSKVISKQSRQKKKVGTPDKMTEYQHAQLDGLERVWDCGKIRFVYKGN